MYHDDEEEIEERGFRINDSDDEELLDIPESMNEDFGLDEEDPDRDG